jgi:hypothetical protein
LTALDAAAAAGAFAAAPAGAAVELAMAALSGPPIALSLEVAAALLADGTALENEGRGAVDRPSDVGGFAPWLAAIFARLAAVAATPPLVGAASPTALVEPPRWAALAAGEAPPLGLTGRGVVAAGFAPAVAACPPIGLDPLGAAAPALAPAAPPATGLAPPVPACAGAATAAFTGA